MKQRWKRIIALVLILTLTFVGYSAKETAKAANFVEVTNRVSTTFPGAPGTVTHVEIPITSNVMINLTNVTVDPVESKSPIKVENVKLLDINKVNEVTYLSENSRVILSFDAIVADSATIGNYYLNVLFSGQAVYFDNVNVNDELLTAEPVLTACIQVASEKEPIQLTVDSVNYNMSKVTPGNSFFMDLTIKNAGEVDCYNAHMSITYDNGLIPGYNVDDIRLGNIFAGKSVSKNISIEVLSDAEPGTRKITVNLTG